jgi:hypothetical protein
MTLIDDIIKETEKGIEECEKPPVTNIYDKLKQLFCDIWVILSVPIIKVFSAGMLRFRMAIGDAVEDFITPLVDPFWQPIYGVIGKGNIVANFINDILHPKHFLGSEILDFGIGFAAGMFLDGLASPFKLDIKYGATLLALNMGVIREFDPDIALKLFDAKLIDNTRLNRAFGVEGYAPNDRELLYTIMKNYTDPQTLFTLQNRKMLQDSEIDLYMKFFGMPVRLQGALLDLRWEYPNIQALFDYSHIGLSGLSDIASKNYPSDLRDLIQATGTKEDHAKMLWNLSWIFPDIGSSFEMYHRNLIKEDELRNILRVNRIPDDYHDNYIAMNYRLYTLRWIKSMYKSGAINDQDVLTNFIKMGYDQEHASKILLWLQKTIGDSAYDLGFSDVKQSYIDGIIDDATAQNYMEMLSYTKEDVAILMPLLRYQKAASWLNQIKAPIKKAWINSQIDTAKAKDVLQREGLSKSTVDDLITIWSTEKAYSHKQPTEAQILGMMDYAIMTKEQAIEKLVAMSYTSEDANNLVELEYRKKHKVPAAKLPKVKLISKADLEKMWEYGVIDEDTWRSDMKELGYTSEDIESFKTLILDKLAEKVAKAQAKKGTAA